jgi:SAM-dependent methyltransferase
MESPDVPWAKRDDGRIRKRPVEPPSVAAAFFLDFLKSRGIVRGRMVDIGCGTGRNAVFFAEMGFEVHAVDRSEDVLKDIDLHGVMPHCHSVTDGWLFEDGFFDLAMDIFCFSEQDRNGHRGLYFSELQRVLKPGAYLLLCVPASMGPKERIGAEFPGFGLAESVEYDDRIHGKAVKALGVILRKI